MIIRITHELGERALALHVEPDVVFVGHAHAAVHLHAFAHREVARRAALALATETISSARSRAAVEQLLRLHHHGLGNFDLGIEVRGAVLQRLELADQLAELLALLR